MVALVLDGLVGFPAGLSPTSFHLSPSSFHLSPKLGACGRVPGWLVSHFLSFVSHFFSFVSQFFSFVWVLVVGFPAGLSPTSFHLSPTSFHLSPSSFHLSPRLGACGRVPGWLVSHFLSLVSHFFSFVSQFFSFVSQAGCLWSGLRLACLPLPFICLPLLFICPGWVACLPRPFFICLPLLSICHLSPSSFYLSPRLPFICLPLLFNCLLLLFIVSQAECFWSGSRPFPLAIWCPPFSADVRPFPLAM